MKRYSLKTLNGMTGAQFARDVLQTELNGRDPTTPVAGKLRDTISQLQYMEDGISYGELATIFQLWERSNPGTHLRAYITFTPDSFGEVNLSWVSRTYEITSDNKAFKPGMAGYSIYGRCLDNTDNGIRLERYMAAEGGGKDGWKIENCQLIGGI